MLPKENRLKNKKDFENLFKNGKGVKDGFLHIRFLKNNLEYSRFGFVAGIKFSKKAVDRNRIKRLLREAVKEKLKYFKKGVDIAIVASSGFKKGDAYNIKERLEKLFRKANLISH